MVDTARIPEKTMKKFDTHAKSQASGLFTNKVRKQLLTQPHSRGHSKSMFWYRIRNQVRSALVDLEMFTALANRHNVDQVMTTETVGPIVKTLLYHTFPDPDRSRALIAELFIAEGFAYLRRNCDVGTSANEQAIDIALNVANYLATHLRENTEEGE